MRQIWTTLLARLASPKESVRFRVIGALILACGVLGGGLYYLVEAPSAAPTMDDSNALGYTRAQDHQMGLMMGHFGLILMDWQDALDHPGAQALVIVAVAGLIAAYFFRAASVLDYEEEERERRQTSGPTTTAGS